MRTLKNLSSSPLRVSLPGGKTLHLGPGKSACVGNGVTDHPALKRLCDDGLVELGDVAAAGAATTRPPERGPRNLQASLLSGGR